MASLLAGARLVLRRGVRFLPACTVRAPAVPARCFSRSARFLTTAVQEKRPADVEHVPLAGSTQSESDHWSLYNMGSQLKMFGRISKMRFLRTFEEVCKTGKLSSSQVWFLLQTCGNSMPEVPPAERTELAKTIWSQLQELGVVFNESHYNTLLKIYLENDHKFSPTEFLADMEAAQVQPDEATYRRLIAAYCNEGDIEGASKILEFMKSKNLPITETVFNYLITGHARSGDMESARNILPVMQGAGLAPTKGTYLALICSYAEKGDIESIKQTLDSHKTYLTDKDLLKVIFALTKAGHSPLVPDIFQLMGNCVGYKSDVKNLCLALLTEGHGDTAVQLAKKFIPVHHPISDILNQPGSFFLRHCVNLNIPLADLKRYVTEFGESALHHSPLQYALYCALDLGKQELAIELIRTLKMEGLPVRCHYFWPLLAAYHGERDLRGFLQVLRAMKDIGVEADVDTFFVYVLDMFEDVESAHSILQSSEFNEGFTSQYLSALRRGLLSYRFKHVHSLLSSNIPFVSDKSFQSTLKFSFARSSDVTNMAKITKLLYLDLADRQKPWSEPDSVGYFLYGMIGSMSDSEVQAREEHLKQYFHQLKEMGITIGPKKVASITRLLQNCNVPLLIEEINGLSFEDMDAKIENIAEIEQEIEMKKLDNQPIEGMLMALLSTLLAEQDLDKALEIKSKYGDSFTFGMYMKVLALCCSKNNPQEALKIKEEINQKGFPELPTTAKYINLFKVLALNGLIEDAINILKEMQERNVDVNNFTIGTCSLILNTLAKKGDVDSVNRLHEHIVMLGLVKPTNNICSPLVAVHLERNDLPAALDALIDCSQKYKCIVLEHALLLNLVNSGETDLLKKAVDHLSYIMGERLMLHGLLFAFIESEKYAEAQKIAETPGLRANPGKLKWFIDQCKLQNKVEMLEKLVEITKVVFECNREEMYFELLNLYDKNQEWTKVKPLLYKMKDEGLAVSERTVKLFRNIFRKNGENFADHIAEFAPIIANTDSDHFDHFDDYSKRVLVLCKDCKFNEAYGLFLKTEENKTQLSKTAYARLIKGLLEGGLMEDAIKVEEVAKIHYSDYNMENVSCNLFLAEQLRRDCLKDALVTVERMLGNGRMPSRVMLNKLSEAFAMKGDVKSLEKMEKIAKDSNVELHKIDKQFFNTKLLAYFRTDNHEEATSMIESHYIGNEESQSLFVLLSKLVKNNMSEDLEKVSIVAERLANQFSIYRPVTELFLTHVQSGKEDEARHLLQRCNGILEQKEFIRTHITKKCFRDQEEYVFQLLDLLSDPKYNQTAYDCLMKRYFHNRSVESASALYERMKSEQIEPSAISLRLLATLLKKADKPVPFLEPQESVHPTQESATNESRLPEDKH